MKTRSFNIVMIGIIAYMLQSCTHDIYVDPQAGDKASYDNADAVNGAKLFSNFEHVDAGWPADALGWPLASAASDPTITIANIANPPTGQTGQKNRSFYSCSGCHAFDGLGQDGGYITKTLYTVTAGVASATPGQPLIAASHLRDCRSWDITQLFNTIKNVGGRAIDPTLTVNGVTTPLGNSHPDYSKILTDDKIWDIVKWLREGAIYNENNDLYTLTASGPYNTTLTPFATPTTAVYSNLGGTDGDAVAGDAFYVAKCMVCHGNGGRGTSLASGPSGNTVNNTYKVQVGDFVRTRTAEAINTIFTGKFGAMPWMAATPITKDDMKNLLKALSNTTKYPSGAITPNKQVGGN